MTATLAPPDPRAVRAWFVYRESLRGLSGAEYEAAEARAWNELQAALAELDPGDSAPPAILG